MLLYFVGLQILLFDRHIPYAMMGRKYLIAIYGILFFKVMLVYINGDFNEKLEQEILLQKKDRQITDLTAYSKQSLLLVAL